MNHTNKHGARARLVTSMIGLLVAAATAGCGELVDNRVSSGFGQSIRDNRTVGARLAKPDSCHARPVNPDSYLERTSPT